MKALKPLVCLLQRSLRAALLRRWIAWMACALILIVLGSALSQLFGNARMIRLGLVMGVLSALPAFLLWPPSERLLTDRLRRIDEEMVFEAYLEAEPGPTRDILRRLAAERAAALPFIQLPRESIWAGLWKLCVVAAACFVFVEVGSFLIIGRSLTLTPEQPVTAERGKRIEETGFSDFTTEDPMARRTQRERALERKEKDMGQGENPALGHSGEPAERVVSSNRAPNPGMDSFAPNESSTRDSIAKRKQGEREEDGTASGSNSSSTPGGTPDQGNRKTSEPGGNRGQAGMIPSENVGSGRTGPPPAPGRTSQGYEHTADTKVPSPLLDYRSQFEARYAERTGRHISASGHMGFGELRDFQRRYFDTFTLKADVGAADDPYVAQLKRRWTELKGGTW